MFFLFVHRRLYMHTKYKLKSVFNPTFSVVCHRLLTASKSEERSSNNGVQVFQQPEGVVYLPPEPPLVELVNIVTQTVCCGGCFFIIIPPPTHYLERYNYQLVGYVKTSNLKVFVFQRNWLQKDCLLSFRIIFFLFCGCNIHFCCKPSGIFARLFAR